MAIGTSNGSGCISPWHHIGIADYRHCLAGSERHCGVLHIPAQGIGYDFLDFSLTPLLRLQRAHGTSSGGMIVRAMASGIVPSWNVSTIRFRTFCAFSVSFIVNHLDAIDVLRWTSRLSAPLLLNDPPLSAAQGRPECLWGSVVKKIRHLPYLCYRESVHGYRV